MLNTLEQQVLAYLDRLRKFSEAVALGYINSDNVIIIDSISTPEQPLSSVDVDWTNEGF